MAEKKKRSLFRRILRVVGVLFALILVAAGVGLYFLMKVETVKLDDHLYALLGGGGNSLVLLSDEGPLVVDTKFGPPSGKLQKEVERIAGKPVKMVVDTHWHLDHTHGNPKFPGAEFVGSTKTRGYLLGEDDMFKAGGEGASMVPTTLVDDSKSFQFGDDFVEVRAVGAGHTDGDVVVFLHKRSLLHTGDLYVNGVFPIIDEKHGGSLRALGPTLDKIIAIGAKTVVPGHGPITDTNGVKVMREYVTAVWDHALAGARAGKSRDEVVKSFDASRWPWGKMGGFTTPQKNVGVAYDEAVALVTAEKK
jgi:glyoxylase-like metal-dependent hydrolase (beta-lactamase superfamily II)